MQHYDLRYEPWIVAKRNNKPDTKIGIEEALINAHTYTEFEASTGIHYDTYAINRLLMTIIFDIYKPDGASGIASIFREGKFDAEKIREYLGRYCWDMYDEQKLFMQYIPEEMGKTLKEKPIASLSPLYQTGNEDIFHMRTPRIQPTKKNQKPEDLTPFAPDEAAATLVRIHVAYAKYGNSQTASSPICNGQTMYVTAMAIGDNAFQTIVLALPVCSIYKTEGKTAQPMWARDHYELRKSDVKVNFLPFAFLPILYVRIGDIEEDGMVHTVRYYPIKREPEEIGDLSDLYLHTAKGALKPAVKTAYKAAVIEENAHEPHIIQMIRKNANNEDTLDNLLTPDENEVWFKILENIQNISVNNSYLEREKAILEQIRKTKTADKNDVVKAHDMYGLRFPGKGSTKKQFRCRIQIADELIGNEWMRDDTGIYLRYMRTCADNIRQMIRNEYKISAKRKKFALADNAIAEYYDEAKKMFMAFLKELQSTGNQRLADDTLEDWKKNELKALFKKSLDIYRKTPAYRNNVIERQKNIEKVLANHRREEKKVVEKT